MLRAFLSVLAILTFSSPLFADQTFMPKNRLDLDTSNKAYGGLNQAQFNKVIDRAELFYKPIFQQFGATLKINRLWEDSTVNASAEQTSATMWEINMYGGLAKRSEVTEDGFAAVLCHEIGHHLGGYPFVQDWAADEGQSDMYATGACAYKIFAANYVLAEKAFSAIPASLKAKCDANHSSSAEQDICYRAVVAGKSLADLLGALGGTSVGYETPDTSVVTKTNHKHPAAQCRFDTYAASAYCGSNTWDHALIPGKSFSDRNSMEAQTEAFAHSCETGDGARPKCWFAAVDANTPPDSECPLGDEMLCALICQISPQPWCP